MNHQVRGQGWQQADVHPPAEDAGRRGQLVSPQGGMSRSVAANGSALAGLPLSFPDHVASQRKFPISSRVFSGITAAFDSLCIVGTGAILYLLMVNYSNDVIPTYAAAVSFVWFATLLMLHFAGLYQFDAITRPLVYVDKLIIAFATAFLFLFAATFALKISATFSRMWMGVFVGASCTSTLFVRLLVTGFVSRLSDNKIFTRNVIVAGNGEQSARLLNHIRVFKPRFVSVLGVFADKSVENATDFCGYPVLGTLDDIGSYVRTRHVDDAIVAMPWAAEGNAMRVIDTLQELPLNIYLGSDLIGYHVAFRPPPSHFGTMPIIEVADRPLSGWAVLWKTVEDYVLAGVATLLLLPLVALVAIAVKLDSRGPVLFRQKRFGFNNKVFEIYKFRTMRHATCPEGTTVQATRDDPRVTAVGRFLRRTSLDELPQLFNVLNGTMSLVGPRPHAIDHNETYSQQIRSYYARHRVKPGITGWAQVNGLRGQTDTPEKMAARVKHDIYYMENWSLLFDLAILARTVVIALTGRNAY